MTTIHKHAERARFASMTDDQLADYIIDLAATPLPMDKECSHCEVILAAFTIECERRMALKGK